jgi:hypothetical protein
MSGSSLKNFLKKSSKLTENFMSYRVISIEKEITEVIRQGLYPTTLALGFSGKTFLITIEELEKNDFTDGFEIQQVYEDD